MSYDMSCVWLFHVHISHSTLLANKQTPHCSGRSDMSWNRKIFVYTVKFEHQNISLAWIFYAHRENTSNLKFKRNKQKTREYSRKMISLHDVLIDSALSFHCSWWKLWKSPFFRYFVCSNVRWEGATDEHFSTLDAALRGRNQPTVVVMIGQNEGDFFSPEIIDKK